MNQNTFIDTHVHLTFPDYDKDRESVIARAWDAGLEYIITIGAGEGLDDNFKAVALAETDPRIFASVGVHPHDAEKVRDDWFVKLANLARNKKVVAIGEIGLDFYHNKSSKAVQIEVFRKLIRLAHEVDLPISIHARDANEEVLKILLEEGIPNKNGVFHCFSGKLDFAKKVVAEGLKISVPGVITFKKSADLQEVVSEIMLENIMLETDCPFLAPEPYRGKRNEPAFVVEVASKIAEIKKLSVFDVARITTLSARRFFNLPGAEVIPKIAYQIRNSIYLNITNKCTLCCKFCPKHTDYEVKGHYLRLLNEPNVEEIFLAVGQPDKYDEVVFCGYGEPTQRLEILKVIAKMMKENGAKRVRLNTDGLANLIYGRNVVRELGGLIDSVSISLNAPDAKTYAKICPSQYGEAAYNEVLNFIRECKIYIPEVKVTAVTLPGLSMDDVKKVAEELGVEFHAREYMNMG